MRPALVRISKPHRVGDGPLAMSRWSIAVFHDSADGFWALARVVQGRDLREAVLHLRRDPAR
jgi:hypothetical protein